jgi:DNA-binding transcriptional LysR family regulator
LASKKAEMKFGSLQVAWLIAFVESADYKGTAAAATLGVNESTVSKYIGKLESWYGGGPRRLLMLGNMHPRILTEDGKEFLPVAREIIGILRAQPTPWETSPVPTKVSVNDIRLPVPTAFSEE